jgi:hypothetical protein
VDDREQVVIILDPNLSSQVEALVAEGDGPVTMALKIVAAAQSLAPLGNTGLYRDGIHAKKTPHGARVLASDNKSSWVEFGIPSHNQPAQFVLRRAAESVGLRFTKRKR